MYNKRVNICACISRSFIDKDKVAVIASILKSNGYLVTIEPDLCKKIMQTLPDEKNETKADMTLACYSRAVDAIYKWKGLEAEETIDIRNRSVDEVLSQLAVPYSEQDKTAVLEEIESLTREEGTDAWYPVLDKERCIECGKCHDFCLFGVYAIANKEVKVIKPQNCKNNCPACARMCPSKAIIFPKYDKSPINGGMDMEEPFNPQEIDAIYKERLRYRLQQRKNSVSLIKNGKE